MHGDAATGLWLCLLGLVPGPGIAPGAAAPVEARDELVEFLEFLGDENTAGETWNGFFDNLTEGGIDSDIAPKGAPTTP